MYRDPELYDELYGDFREDNDFYLRLATEHSGECLELACGTGRVCLSLAAAGHRVVGIDLSPEMIERATQQRKKAKIPTSRCELLEADMRSFIRPARFSLVIVPLQSLSHLLTTEDLLRCLGAVHENLAEGGCFACAVHNPDPSVLAREPGALFRVPFDLDDTAVYESSEYDSPSQVLSLQWYVVTTEHTRRFEFALRMFFPQELSLLFERVGFEIEHRYGWYDESPFTSASGTQVIVARKRDGTGDPSSVAR